MEVYFTQRTRNVLDYYDIDRDELAGIIKADMNDAMADPESAKDYGYFLGYQLEDLTNPISGEHEDTCIRIRSEMIDFERGYIADLEDGAQATPNPVYLVCNEHGRLNRKD